MAWFPDDGSVVCGGADSTVRVWNATSARTRLRISVQDQAGDKTLVWALQVLPDRTIVSGDSKGRTQLWDSQFGTLIQSFAEHEADVLAVEAGCAPRAPPPSPALPLTAARPAGPRGTYCTPVGWTRS